MEDSDIHNLDHFCEEETPSVPEENPGVLSRNALKRMIGITRDVPMSPADMAISLRVAFYPSTRPSEKLTIFLNRLREALSRAGTEVMDYENALTEGADGRIGRGIVLIASGEGEPGNLAIDHVPSLRDNTVIAILDGTLPDL